MSKKLLTKYIWLSPLYVFIQVFILNDVLFASYINPYLYILLIITLPKNTPNWFLLLYAFCLGLAIDIFVGTVGFHSTASVFIAFLKPSITKISIPQNIISEGEELQLQKIGIQPFLIFTFILTLTHHSSLFLLEHLSFTNFLRLTLKICLSSIITTALIMITQLLYFRKK